jgi:hypothetical protein
VGFRPYFTYDGSGRVTQMTLEAVNPAENRTTYYDYDASSRMNRQVGPELCITYFDYL